MTTPTTTKRGPKKKNPDKSIRATIILPKNTNDLLTLIASEQCRSLTAQALFFIQEGIKAHELEGDNGDIPT